MNGAESSATPMKTRIVPAISRRSTRLRPVREQAPDQQREAERGEERGDGRAEAREPARRQRRALAHRRDRRHACRAQRREEARDQRHEDPERERDDDRPGLEEEAAVRQREADRVEQPEEPLREREPEEEPDHRGDEAHDERLEHDRPAHLPPRGAERPQRRELARPLGDRDRQRVDDHERADEQRDHAEREQEVAQEGDELVRPLGVLGRLCGRRCAPGCRRRKDLLDLGDELRRARRRACRTTRIWSSLPSLSKSRCAVGRSKPASVAPPIESTEPNLTSPEIRSVSTGPSTWTPIESPTSRSFLLAVDLSTTTSSAFGQAPSTSVRRVELAARDGSTEKPRFGAPPKTIALPSFDELRVLARDAADRVGDVRQRPDLREQRLVERRLRRPGAVLDVERGLGR